MKRVVATILMHLVTAYLAVGIVFAAQIWPLHEGRSWEFRTRATVLVVREWPRFVFGSVSR